MPKKKAKTPVMGRPKVLPEKSPVVHFVCPPKVLSAIDRAATTPGVLRSEVIREWLSERAERE